MDPQLLSYDFDEEGVGFGTPETPAADPSPGLSVGQKAALALVGIGLLSLTVQIFGSPLTGTWYGLASSFGALSI